MLYRDPAVYVVEQNYQITFNTLEPGIAWVEIGGNKFCDSENGLMRSETLIHKVTVQMSTLDAAKEYTVCFRALPERRPYFPELGELKTKSYAFTPVPEDGIRAVMLCDCHSMIDLPCAAAKALGAFDLLILGGDIPAESKKPEDIRAIFEIISELTHGEKPVIFARGNHDLRGRLANDLPQYIGVKNNDTWFTFRLGSLWGIIVDCGEDKVDGDVEYGGLVDCHPMRLKELRFLDEVLARADREFDAEGVKTRVAICHVPFATNLVGLGDPKFNIELDIYEEWTHRLNQMKLDAMLCGHTHKLSITMPGTEWSRMDAAFPTVVTSAPNRSAVPGEIRDPNDPNFIAAGVTFENGTITVDSATDTGVVSPYVTLKK